MIQVVLSTGSNIGDRASHLSAARSEIIDKIGPEVISSPVYESKPWGFEDPVAFLNQVVVLQTDKSAQDCLSIISSIEKGLGRVRYSETYASRVIDIDILFFGNHIIQDPDLTVPHPHIADRKFVLVPLVEVLPDFVHPVSGKSMKVLLAETKDI